MNSYVHITQFQQLFTYHQLVYQFIAPPKIFQSTPQI